MSKYNESIFIKRNLKRYLKIKHLGLYNFKRKQPFLPVYYLEIIFILINYVIFKRIYIPQVEFLITTYCTLNCKYCSNYISQLEDKNRKHLSFENFKVQLDNLLKNIYKLNSLIIVGGEPLLNPDFNKILQYSLSQKKVENVYIFINGTLIFRPEDIEILKRYRKKVCIFLSNYSSNEKVLPLLKNNKIKELLNKNKIKYIYNEKTYWVKQDPIISYGRTADENSMLFCKCGVPSVSVVDGFLHVCPKAAAAQSNGIINFDSEDRLDLNNPISKEDIISFYSNSRYKICGHCAGPEATRYIIFPAEQV